MWNKISDMWCKTMHKRAMWPIHGRYRCSECFREHSVMWQPPAKPIDASPAAAPVHQIVDGPGRYATM